LNGVGSKVAANKILSPDFHREVLSTPQTHHKNGF